MTVRADIVFSLTLVEGAGFEPAMHVNAYRLSKATVSATHPPFHAQVLAITAGFEPATSAFGEQRSIR